MSVTVTSNPSNYYLLPIVMCLAMAAPKMTLLAQNLEAEITIEEMDDGDFDEAEEEADLRTSLIEAIENSNAASEEIRMLFKVDKISIAYVSEEDLASDKVAEAVESNKDAVDALRVALESNALLYHAIQSRDFEVANVLAVESVGEHHLRFYVAGEQPE